MGNLVFQATLGGQVNLVGPNTASTYNINIPAVAGNMVTTGDTGTVTSTMLASSVYTAPGTIGSGTPNTGAFTTLTLTNALGVAYGGTNATSFTGKSGNVAGLVFYDGTKLTNDATVTDVGYDTSTNTVKANNLSISGTQTYADGSTQNTAATGFGFKNRIINGAMMIDQRNAGASVTNPSGYTLDRWQASASGGSINVQQVAGTGAYAYDALLTGGSGVTHAYFYQRIESLNCLDLTSKSVTFQAQLSSTTATSVTISLYVPSTANSFPGSLLSSTTISINSTPTIYSWTVNAGANAANGLQVQIDFGALTSGTARVSGVQLEKGSTATSFDYRPYGTELALCQRYCNVIRPLSTYTPIGVGRTWSGSNGNVGYYLPVSMRSNPTVTYSALSDFDVVGAGNPTAIGNDGASNQAVKVGWAKAGVTSGAFYQMEFNTNINAWLAFSAEL